MKRLFIFLTIVAVIIISLRIYQRTNINNQQGKELHKSKKTNNNEAKEQHKNNKPPSSKKQRVDETKMKTLGVLENLKEKINSQKNAMEFIDDLIKIQKISLEGDLDEIYIILEFISKNDDPVLRGLLVLALGINKLDVVARNIARLVVEDKSKTFRLAGIYALAIIPEALESDEAKEKFWKAIFVSYPIGEWLTPEFYRESLARQFGCQPEDIILMREIFESYKKGDSEGLSRLYKRGEGLEKSGKRTVAPEFPYEWFSSVIGLIQDKEALSLLTDALKKDFDPFVGNLLIPLLPINNPSVVEFFKEHIDNPSSPYNKDFNFILKAAELSKKNQTIDDLYKQKILTESDEKKLANMILFAQPIDETTLIDIYKKANDSNLKSSIIIKLSGSENFQNIVTDLYFDSKDSDKQSILRTLRAIVISNPKFSLSVLEKIYYGEVKTNFKEQIIDTISNSKSENKKETLLNLYQHEKDSSLQKKLSDILSRKK